jgi:serine/threonine-protein kinase
MRVLISCQFGKYTAKSLDTNMPSRPNANALRSVVIIHTLPDVCTRRVGRCDSAGATLSRHLVAAGGASGILMYGGQRREMALESGQKVDDRYRIEELLAQGGMGAVYRAWDTRLSRDIALKEMIPQPGLDEEMLAQLRLQFQHEAQVLADLVHPNLVRVTDYFSWDDKEYLVMDFVEGEGLAHRIEEQGPQPESEVLHWASMLLDALAYCHKQGIIHRDIKPQNIIITPEGEAVLVDFGLVKLWNANDPRTKTVMRGAGTPQYAPPEQYDAGMGHTDPRSDVYALGATLYHALTGHVPPTATQRMANPSSFVPPHQIPVALEPNVEGAILKAMAVAMDQRFQSAEEMAVELRLPTRRLRPRPRPPAPGQTQVMAADEIPTPRKKSRVGIWLGIGAAAVVCVGLSIVGILSVINNGEGGDVNPTEVVISTEEPTAQSSVVVTTPPDPTNPPPPPPTTAPPVVTGRVFLQDDFSDPGSGWEIGDYEEGSVGYGAGYYFVSSILDGQTMWGVASQEFSDLTIEVDATQFVAPANNNNGYGVKCRVQPGGTGGDGYAFLVSGDGFYTIQVIVDGSYEPLIEWTASSAVNQGYSTNRLRVVCDGTQLLFFANDELLGEVTDSTYSSGDISLMAVTLEAETTEVHFDNLMVAGPGAAAAGPILYQDDFGDPSSGWEVQDYGDTGVAEYGAGYYRMVGAMDGIMVWTVGFQNFADLIMEVDTTQISAAPNNNNGYGMMCRLQPGTSGDGYAFLISGDGYYSIQLITKGDYEPLVEWATSPVVNQGNSANHLRVICDGTYLALIVNGELLAETNDASYTEGDIAFVTGTLEPEPTEVHFDNLVVYRALR